MQVLCKFTRVNFSLIRLIETNLQQQKKQGFFHESFRRGRKKAVSAILLYSNLEETFCLDPSVVDPDPELLPDPDSARMKEEKN